MKVYDAASIRNVALAGHSGSGKTQLASAILFDAGMVNRLGRVDEGTTVTDYDEEEVARKHTLAATLAYAEWNKQKINLIDTPGMANFLTDARAALKVADAGADRRRRRVRRAGLDREGLGHRGRARTAANRRAQPARPRARQHGPVPGVDPSVARTRRGADSAPDRRGEGLQGRRRSRRDEGVHVPGRRVHEDVGGRDSRLDEGCRRAGPRGAHRDGGRSGRSAHGEVLRRGHADAGRARRRTAQGGNGGEGLPVVCTSATTNVGVQPLLDAVVAYVPSPADRPVKGRHPKTGAEADGDGRTPRAPPPPTSGKRWPTHSPAGLRCSA